MVRPRRPVLGLAGSGPGPGATLTRCLGFTTTQLGLYLAGCISLSTAIGLLTGASLADDATTTGVAAWIGLPHVQACLAATGAIALALCLRSVWNRRLPAVSTIVTVALVGFLAETWNGLGLSAFAAGVAPSLLLLAGLSLAACALTLVVTSGIGPRVTDLLADVAGGHLGRRVTRSDLLIEGGLLSLGVLLGGPAAIATAAFVAVACPLAGLSVRLSGEAARLPAPAALGPLDAEA